MHAYTCTATGVRTHMSTPIRVPVQKQSRIQTCITHPCTQHYTYMAYTTHYTGIHGTTLVATTLVTYGTTLVATTLHPIRVIIL